MTEEIESVLGKGNKSRNVVSGGNLSTHSLIQKPK